MNRKAQQIGMKKSTFKTPHGLPAKGQFTTAKDMLTLARCYLRDHPDVMRFHRMRTFNYRGITLRNTNTLLGKVKGVDGLKTGWTVASGYNLIFTAKRGNTRLLGVVMGGKTRTDRDTAAKQILEAGFKFPSSTRKVTATLNKSR